MRQIVFKEQFPVEAGEQERKIRQEGKRLCICLALACSHRGFWSVSPLRVIWTEAKEQDLHTAAVTH